MLLTKKSGQSRPHFEKILDYLAKLSTIAYSLIKIIETLVNYFDK